MKYIEIGGINTLGCSRKIFRNWQKKYSEKCKSNVKNLTKEILRSKHKTFAISFFL